METGSSEVGQEVVTKKNTTPRAYYVYDRTNEDHGGEITFALTAAEARRSVHLDDCEFVNYATRRQPEFDMFVVTGRPPTTREKLERGFWRGCGGCSKHRLIENDPIFVGDEVYCSIECQAREEGRVLGRKWCLAEREQLKEEALAVIPLGLVADATYFFHQDFVLRFVLLFNGHAGQRAGWFESGMKRLEFDE